MQKTSSFTKTICEVYASGVKVYHFTGCHGTNSGDNWVQNGDDFNYHSQLLDNIFYMETRAYNRALKGDNRSYDMRTMSATIRSHFIMVFCWSNNDIVIQLYLQSVDAYPLHEYVELWWNWHTLSYKKPFSGLREPKRLNNKLIIKKKSKKSKKKKRKYRLEKKKLLQEVGHDVEKELK